MLFIRETQISGVSELKFVSRTIPMKSEGIIPRSSAAEYVSPEFSGLWGFIPVIESTLTAQKRKAYEKH